MTLEFRNVTIPTGRGQVLAGLSFVADGGRLTCLVGHGATAVLRAAMGLLPVSEGYISVDGELLTPLSAASLRRLMAYVPRLLTPVGHYPVYEPPTPGDLLTLKANRGVRGGGNLFDVAGQLGRPLLLVDNDDAVADWLRRMANGGAAVLMATCKEEVAAVADSVVRLE